MPIVTVKSGSPFPEIGQIRKGLPKEDGKVGKDLKTKFRVHFYPGVDNDRSRALFASLHEPPPQYGGELVVDSLRVAFPFADPTANWDYWYEAYRAGRMIARADGVKFIRLVDGPNVIVDNGEPFTPCNPKEPIKYRGADGKMRESKLTAAGRLQVVLPELQRYAYFTVMTTSIYDVVRITQQLNGIKYIGSLLPHGKGVSGIPITITRRLVDVTWVQADGSAKRVKQGLLNMEIDQDWVALMLDYMARQALPTGHIEQALLPTGDEVVLDIPEEAQGIADEALDGEFLPDEEPEPEPEPELWSPADVKAPKGTRMGTLTDDQLTLLAESKSAQVTDEMRRAAKAVIEERIAMEMEKVLEGGA